MRGSTAENNAAPIACGANYDWIYGNILLDRDRFNQGRAFGLAFADGYAAFGLNNEFQAAWTLCSSQRVLDGSWHHVAVQRRRSDGRLWLHVDGVLEAEADGPDGDVSYPDNGTPGDYCGGPCVNSDPFVVLGAEKHDAGPSFPAFNGWLDELRFSSNLRYGGAGFVPPAAAFVPDADTVALYHFDALPGDCSATLSDSSGASGGPSDGACSFGGAPPPGPAYSESTPFVEAKLPALSAAGLALLTGAFAAGGALLSWRRPK